ncbi:MAG: DUF2752 domain-containing protein [Muribaculaceae bacterium]|nr:DUF2752 domain-containing protein [Muribaculaceae bacterium]
MAIGFAAVAIVLFYGLNDPARVRSPKCVLKVVTGFDCPGCGAQRALHALLHGHICEAWSYNPFLFFLVPLAALYSLGEFFGARFPNLEKILYSRVFLYMLILCIVAWWILRNLF